jgi:uncharacterized protein involved in type VI secretion and phage assembly
MHRMVQTIQQIARHEAEQCAAPALAVVKSVHGSGGASHAYACTVQLRDSGVVLPKVPIATQVIGHAALPREHDLVLVAFAGGDLHAPVVVGRLYNEEVAPPKHEEGEFVTILPGDETDPSQSLELRVKTPGDGTRSVALTLSGNSVSVEVTIDDQTIRLKTQDASLELTQSGASDGKAELKVGEAKVTLEQSGDVSVQTSGKLTLKAADIEIKADSSVKISGATVEVN